MPLRQLLMAPELPNWRCQPSSEACAAFRDGFESTFTNPSIRPLTSLALTDMRWHYLRWASLDAYKDSHHFGALFSSRPEFAARNPLNIADEMQYWRAIREARQHILDGGV
ncbi:hypothetical protein V2A60_000802 [Cordyceps javanica]